MHLWHYFALARAFNGEARQVACLIIREYQSSDYSCNALSLFIDP